MVQARTTRERWPAFAAAADIGLALPGVRLATKYDGSPILQVDGRFMAGVAMHPSAERDTLVVRVDPEARACLLAEGGDAYYLTSYYEPHPVVLVRLGKLDRQMLRDLLSMSRRLSLARRDRPPQA